jgi:hypothetical protein
LEKIFKRALEYEVSLNYKKCHFSIIEGKLLHYIVSKEGVRIFPERFTTIDKTQVPKNLKAIQSFFGQIYFVRRFISNFLELVKPISKMMNKNANISLNDETLKEFGDIKKAIKDVHVLRSLDFSKPFQLFSFASFHTIAAILLKKNEDGHE